MTGLGGDYLAQLNGYIKLHRSMLNWSWHADPNTAWLFVNLLLLANCAPAEWKGMKIDRGQVITGRKALSEQTGISEQSVRTSLNRLKSTGEITIKPTNKFSLITIVNYEKFQGSDVKSTRKSTSNLANNQPATNHNVRIKEEKEIKTRFACTQEGVTDDAITEGYYAGMRMR